MKANAKEKPTPAKTQAQRREDTKALLLDTARELFLMKGYDQTGMPELVQKVGLTRGALYYHFSDKADLFKAVAERDAVAIASEIDEATKGITDHNEAMRVGTNAYFDAMATSGRATILLTYAPAILGVEQAKTLTETNGSAELKSGLERALDRISDTELGALTDVLSAAFDRAALEIAKDADRDAYVSALNRIIGKLLKMDQ